MFLISIVKLNQILISIKILNLKILNKQKNIIKTTFLQQTKLLFDRQRSEKIANMIAKNIKFINHKTKINLIKQNILLSHNLFIHNRLRYNVTDSIQHKLKSFTQKNTCLYSNNYKQQNSLIKESITNKPQYLFSVQQKIQSKNQQQEIDYNDYNTLLQLKRLQQKQPSSFLSFHQKRQPTQNLSNKYKIISYQYEQKLQMLQKIIHSNERNLFKIIQELVIVIQSLVQINKRQVLQQNLIKVLKQFNNKLISSHLENLSQLEYYQKDSQIGGRSKQEQQEGIGSKQQNDNNYGLHQKYRGNKDHKISGFEDDIETDKNQYRNISNLKNNLFNIKFICFYIEAIKDVILKKLDNQTLIKQVQQQIYQFLTARQVSDIQDLIKKQISNLQQNYINQKDFKKRSLYPFQKKLRLICLIPYFQNKQNIDKYLNRLADQNLIIYLKQSQMINLMYDIFQQQIIITRGEYVYQIQATLIYQTLSSINACYIKSQFIDYVRKFMVCYQEIQFYEIFKDLEQKLKNSSIKTFIRALKILKSQSGDLHCQYNKTMNKYNWNILISIIISQVYTLQNTKLDDLLQMYQSINSADSSGQVLYEQLARYLKQFNSKPQLKYSGAQIDRLYRIFNYALQQIKPIQKYNQRDGLNKQFTKRTYNLVTTLIDIVGQKYPQSFLKSYKFLRFYLQKDYSPYFIQHYLNNQINLFPYKAPFKEISGNQQTKLKKIASSLKLYEQNYQKYSILNKQKIGQMSTTEYLNIIRQFYKKKLSRKLSRDVKEVNNSTSIQKKSDSSNITNYTNQVDNSNSNKQAQSQSQKMQGYPFYYQIYHINHRKGQLKPKQFAQFDNKLFKNLILPLFKQYQNLMLNAFYNFKADLKLSASQKIHIYQNLLILLKILNSMSFSPQYQTKSFVQQIHYYSKTIHTSIFTQMKHKIVQRQLQQQKQIKENRKYLNLSTASYHNTMLICLEYISQLNKKIFDFENTSKQQNLSASTTQHRQKFLQQNLPLIYKFMNKIAISDFKNINKNHIVNMLSLMRKIQFVRSSTTPVLLLQFNINLYEYLYQSLSMFILYTSQRGKFYMSLFLIKDPQMVDVINQFVSKKNQFRNIPNKRKLVPLQIIMVQLIRKKIIKIKETHLKKNQHSILFLQFLQIFESPQNITADLKNQLKLIEFTNNVLQDFPNDFLQEFSQFNGSISRYLEDKKIGLGSIKKLSKMDADELKKQFQSGRSSKMYEMVLKNHKFNLPFQLPKPKQRQSQNTKTIYILQCIYQKIKKQQKYQLQIKQRSSKNKKQQTSLTNKSSIIDEYQLFTSKSQSIDQKKPKNENNGQFLFQQFEQSSLISNINKQKDSQKSGGKGKRIKGKRQPRQPRQQKNPSQKQQSTISALRQPLKGKQIFNKQSGQDTLAEQKQYIIKEGLVQHKYEDHYKLNQNQLGTNYKTQTWKTYQFLFKQQEVQSYQIDEKMNQNIYKDILKSILGYVEKIKKVTKELHAHSYIQYIGMSLQLDVIYHGCVVRVSRKNRPQDNILFVCASQTNYKLMYICTYILKQSGQNAYILGQNTKQHDFRQFLQKNLPQSFESQQPEIVQKVLKRGIVLSEQQIQLSKQQ